MFLLARLLKIRGRKQIFPAVGVGKETGFLVQCSPEVQMSYEQVHFTTPNNHHLWIIDFSLHVVCFS